MKFERTSLEGVYEIFMTQHEDDRGSFGRFYCAKEMADVGLDPCIAQMSHSYNRSSLTLRGMHYQLAPSAEVKMVRCLSGELYDVVLDLRPESSTFGKWYSTILSGERQKLLYIPKGFAHGFLTLKDNTHVMYVMSEFHSSQHERGVRWDDPRFDIKWPSQPKVISRRDQEHPLFDPVFHLKQNSL